MNSTLAQQNEKTKTFLSEEEAINFGKEALLKQIGCNKVNEEFANKVVNEIEKYAVNIYTKIKSLVQDKREQEYNLYNFLAKQIEYAIVNQRGILNIQNQSHVYICMGRLSSKKIARSTAKALKESNLKFKYEYTDPYKLYVTLPALKINMVKPLFF